MATARSCPITRSHTALEDRATPRSAELERFPPRRRSPHDEAPPQKPGELEDGGNEPPNFGRDLLHGGVSVDDGPALAGGQLPVGPAHVVGEAGWLPFHPVPGGAAPGGGLLHRDIQYDDEVGLEPAGGPAGQAPD